MLGSLPLETQPQGLPSGIGVEAPSLKRPFDGQSAASPLESPFPQLSWGLVPATPTLVLI